MSKDHQLDELYVSLKNIVFDFFGKEIPLVYGSGNTDSAIVLVGEAPGKHEVLQGKPFVGQAGRNLDEFIDILQINREDLYITNVVKFRTYKVNPNTGRDSNRPPNRQEVHISADTLVKEIGIIKPKLVVTLGNIALRCILKDEKASIGILHANPITVELQEASFTLFPLYHPASIIYNRELKKTYLEDLETLRDYIKENR